MDMKHIREGAKENGDSGNSPDVMQFSMNMKHIRKGAKENGDSGNSPDVMPKWMNLERFQKGQHFYEKHFASCMFATHVSLVVGFGVKNLIGPLKFTKQSNTPEKAKNRYLRTFRDLQLWITGNVWDSSNEAHSSVQRIRRMHNDVADAMHKERNKYGPGALYPEDMPPDEKFISQYDMAMVQSGFMGLLVMYPEKFGIRCTEDELNDLVFFWRGIGYLLGIDDRFNLCSAGYTQARTLCKDIEKDIVVPGLITDYSEELSNAYIDGMNTLLPVHMNSKQSVIAFYRSITDSDLPNGQLSLVSKDYVRYLLMRRFCFLIRYIPGFKSLINWLLKLIMDRFIRQNLHKN